MSETVHHFVSSKVVGAWAETRLAQAFANAGWTVQPVVNDKFYRAMDIDLVVCSPALGSFTIEVKGDRHTSGNVYVEEVGNAELGTLGCLLYTQSDFIAYYFLSEGWALMIPTKAFQAWYKASHSSYLRRTVLNRSGKEKVLTSYGRAIPWQHIARQVPGAYRVENLPRLEVDNGSEPIPEVGRGAENVL